MIRIKSMSTMSASDAETVREYIELNEWQFQEIQNALTEADASDFASGDTVAGTFSKWGVKVATKLDFAGVSRFEKAT